MPPIHDALPFEPPVVDRLARLRSTVSLLLLPLGALLTLGWVGLMAWLVIRAALAAL